ncbi:MAG: hypothetical protein VR70_10465 [Rhodospirillaceae bacterium BRH_c57]|nr:MAG: hypothetical protein VR70_10465 [Rhodospirillaceae bacterium BRH_c57]
MTLKPFYWNFDGLDVTFQGRIPQELVDALEEAKTEAQNSRAPVLVEWQGEAMHVAESGAKGGYAYRCDTGPTGATWFFSRNQVSTNWNIRVSAKSSALASMGLGGVRANLYRFLDAIGASTHRASISRVDYCMDFLADDIDAVTGASFALDPCAFVMHSHTNRADQDDDAGMQMHGASGRYTSVTCGKMPGRQVIVYDKSREVRMKQKTEWWAHWDAARERQQLPTLSGKERIWRVELRAGKAHLKNRWGIASWSELDNKLGDLFARALTDIRYTIPNATDGERFRWGNHCLWDAVMRTIIEDLGEMTTGAEPGVVKTVRREQLVATTEAMVKGLVATWSVASETTAEANIIALELARMAREHVDQNRRQFQACQERARKRYRFITENIDAEPAPTPE